MNFEHEEIFLSLFLSAGGVWNVSAYTVSPAAPDDVVINPVGPVGYEAGGASGAGGSSCCCFC